MWNFLRSLKRIRTQEVQASGDIRQKIAEFLSSSDYLLSFELLLNDLASHMSPGSLRDWEHKKLLECVDTAKSGKEIDTDQIPVVEDKDIHNRLTRWVVDNDRLGHYPTRGRDLHGVSLYCDSISLQKVRSVYDILEPPNGGVDRVTDLRKGAHLTKGVQYWHQLPVLVPFRFWGVFLKPILLENAMVIPRLAYDFTLKDDGLIFYEKRGMVFINTIVSKRKLVIRPFSPLVAAIDVEYIIEALGKLGWKWDASRRI